MFLHACAMEDRHHDAIVTAARTWVGTRFSHQGRRKGSDADRGGVDCLGLLIGIARELSLIAADGTPLAAHDVTDYSKTPDGAKFKATLDRVLLPQEARTPAAGMVGLFILDARPQHVAIISDYSPQAYGMIHAFAPARRVVEHRLDDEWRKRLVRLYRCA